MIFEIKKANSKKLDKIYEDSMKELDSFFKLNWKHNRPKVFLVPDRKTWDSLLERKTKAWMVGLANNKNVYLISPENLEKESNHKYSDKEYFARLKHELVHCFFDVISNSARKPIWLVEGISIFLSGQTKFKTKPLCYKKFINFYEKGGKDLYNESGFAVEFLFKKYGKTKLILLLKKLKEVNSKKDFTKLFKSIYGFDLIYKNFKIL